MQFKKFKKELDVLYVINTKLLSFYNKTLTNYNL